MGDADMTQIMQVQELEELMEDALSEVDDEMTRLFTFMSFLTEQCVRVTSDISTLRKYDRCLMALNLFVVPIILAIGISYGTIGLVELNPILEDGLQMLITLLMYVSGAIGLPFYVFTLWETCVAGNGLGLTCKRGARNTRKENESIPHVIDPRGFSMPDLRDSFETISEFRRLLSRTRNIRLHTRTEEESQHEIRSLPQEVEEATIGASTDSEEREMMKEHDDADTGEQRDLDDLSGECTRLTDVMRNEITRGFDSLQKGENYLFCKDLFNLDLEKALTVEFRKTGRNMKNTSNVEEENFLDITHIQSTPLLDPVTENVGKGDCSTPVLQHNINTDFKNERSEQVIGL